MMEKYILYNTRVSRPLFCFDKHHNGKMIIGEYDELLKIKNIMGNNKEIEIMLESQYYSELERINNIKYDDDFDYDFNHELFDKFLGEELKEIIEYDYESKDRNLNGFPSICKCRGEEDIEVSLWDRLNKYEDYFRNKLAFNSDSILLSEINENIRIIKAAWKNYKKGNIEMAVNQIKKIISKIENDDFFVSELGKSYAIKQVAFFDDMNYNSSGNIGIEYKSIYERMKEHPVTLFRGRISEKCLNNRMDLLHRPYKRNEKIDRQRFTCNGMPALYLSSTSYACWLELNKPNKDLYISSFVANDDAKKLRILNLVIIEELINGVFNPSLDAGSRKKELQDKMISFFPLVLATSYKYVDYHENQEEYIFPEIVMRCLKKFDIDGVAYLSKNLDHDLQFQIGVNIVIPIYKEHLEQGGYGRVCKMFSMSEPKKYSESQKELYEEYKNGSYIYDIYYAQGDGYQPITNKEDGLKKYGETIFASFDNYLVNLEHIRYDG